MYKLNYVKQKTTLGVDRIADGKGLRPMTIVSLEEMLNSEAMQ